MSDKLVIYYSRDGENYVNGSVKNLPVGNCELTARMISEANGADLFKIETVEEYPADYYQTIDIAKDELRKNTRPALKKELQNLDGYEDIYIVGPCWWGTYPMAMFTQLEKLDFSGKTVHGLMSHEGSGLGHSQKDLQKILKGASFSKPLAVHGAATKESEKTIKDWARN